MGITAKSFCNDEAGLQQTVEQLTKYGPVLIEEFLSGDEYTVGIVDGHPIGVMQVLPKTSDPLRPAARDPRPSEEPFIYSIDVKRDYLNRVEYRTFRDEELEAVAMDVWRAFNLRDVARVDIRRDRHGIPNFVEVNPLPGMNPVTSDLIILATGLGWGYDDLIGRVPASAIRRWAA